jgi:uncharacterized lipoprotein YmbA
MRSHHRSLARLASAATVALAVSGCGSGAAPPQDYVLGASATAPTAAVSQADLPVIEIRPVRLPDYLDTTELVTRRAGSQIAASPTGRWGERLSVGASRSLAASLGAQLPNATVTTTAPEPSSLQILVDLDAFEPQAGGNCVLTGRWSLRENQRGNIRSERVAVSVPIGGDSDQEVVAAMTHALDQLAGQIASSIRPQVAEATARPRRIPPR